jgi:hypothetical protein
MTIVKDDVKLNEKQVKSTKQENENSFNNDCDKMFERVTKLLSNIHVVVRIKV